MTHFENTLLISFTDNQKQAQELAQKAGIKYQPIALHHFPDGESKISLPQPLADHVMIYQSLNQPNDKLIDIILVAEGLKNQGVKTITLISPYLCYMRQDKAFHQGEVISQQVIGILLAQYFDNVLTVDAHLHRISHLSQAIPCKKAINITATKPMADYLHHHLEDPFLIGPDGESQQWVANIAQLDNLDYRIANKIRLGDKSVQIDLPKANYQGRHIVLVDDVASTGKTLLAAAEKLKPYKPASISVLVTHALFVGDAQSQLRAMGVNNIWSCNSIEHSTNVISLADLLAKNLEQFIG